MVSSVSIIVDNAVNDDDGGDGGSCGGRCGGIKDPVWQLFVSGPVASVLTSTSSLTTFTALPWSNAITAQCYPFAGEKEVRKKRAWQPRGCSDCTSWWSFLHSQFSSIQSLCISVCSHLWIYFIQLFCPVSTSVRGTPQHLSFVAITLFYFLILCWIF